MSAIENQTFVGLTDLRLLDLSHNELTQLYGWEFRGLEESLRELYLQHNQLVSIAEETFKVKLRLCISMRQNSTAFFLPLSQSRGRG